MSTSVELTRQRLVGAMLNTSHYDTDEKMLDQLRWIAVDENDESIFDKEWRVVAIDTLIRLDEEHHATNEHRPGYTLQRVRARVTETITRVLG